MIKIYTDGSNVHNGKPYSYGGFAYVVVTENKHHVGGDSMSPNDKKPVTNNRAELNAIIYGLKNLSNYIDDIPKRVTVYSDSQWCVNTINGKWAMKKNLDLWRIFIKVRNEYIKLGIELNVEWVKGHAGNHYNEIADKAAGEYCRQAKPLELL